MAITLTKRFGLTTWGAGTPDGPTRAQFNSIINSIETYAAHDAQGTFPNRPNAGNQGNYYWATDRSILYRDDGSAWQSLGAAPGVVGDMVAINFSDAASASVNNAAGYAPIDHRHAAPANPVVAHVNPATTPDPHSMYAFDSDVYKDFPISFHLAGLLTNTGLRVAKWIAQRACTIVSAQAICDSGSGFTYQLWKNGVAPTGMATSSAVGTSVVAQDFADFTMAPGDYLQIQVVSVGTNATDVSVQVKGVNI